MSEKNKTLACRELREVWNEGRMEVIDEIYDRKVVGHNLGNPSFGHEWFRQWIVDGRAAFPDLHFTINDAVAEGDHVALRWTFKGTHEAEFMGIPKTGKKVTITGLTLYHITGDKIVEEWGYWDSTSMMQQLGVS